METLVVVMVTMTLEEAEMASETDSEVAIIAGWMQTWDIFLVMAM